MRDEVPVVWQAFVPRSLPLFPAGLRKEFGTISSFIQPKLGNLHVQDCCQEYSEYRESVLVMDLPVNTGQSRALIGTEVGGAEQVLEVDL